MKAIGLGFSGLLLLLVNIFPSFSQTLIINEVSNGPAGNQEYVEFVVVSDTVIYDCGSPAPPCLDIRGWIFDDNSGYHGGSGIAAGAVRFSQDPLWSCIPLGTIILIYNDADPNPAIPTNDLSVTDGNCTIIAPLNSTLFETNTTTPGAVACSYPATGWTATGNWSKTLLANVGDCARIVNLSGCEVFSVCYGSDNLNNLIFFNTAGGQTVWSFNGIDPTIQGNWSSGSAATTPGDQTPGAPNNAANAAYIAQFNNGCLPITPINVTATSVNAGCTCSGTATATATGSIGGYTYEWLDANFNPIGQTTDTATGLCAGTYHVIATSHIHCSDTATVTLTSSSTFTVDVTSDTICQNDSATITATPSAAGGTYSWAPGGQTSSSIIVSPTTTTTYTVTYNLAGCIGTGSGTVNVNQIPNVSAGNDVNPCENQSITLNATGAASYSWDKNVVNGVPFIPPVGSTTYTVIGTSVAGCQDSDQVVVAVNPLLIPNFAPNITHGCAPLTVNFTNSTVNASNCVWTISNGTTINNCGPIVSTTFNQPGCYDVTLTVSDANGCTNSLTVPNLICVDNAPIANFTVSAPIITSLNPTEHFTNTSSNANNYVWNFGDDPSTSTEVNPTHEFLSSEPSSYIITLIAYSANGCSDTIFKTIELQEDLIFYVPNAFTPDDEDNVNPTFKPVFTSGFNPYNYCLLVFDRWGEIVFESHNSDIGWDGSYGKTKRVQDGVYTWKIDFTRDSNDQRILVVGHVNLLR